MERYWELTDAQIRNPLAQRFNVSPIAIVPMLRLGDDGKLEEVAARCLVPALGWYEWKEVERVDPTTGEVTKAKQPYFIRLPDRRPIAFAGLLSRRNIEGDKSEFTCTILTRDAVGPAAEIHTRMPIALRKNAEAAWLDPALTDAAVEIEFARGVKLVESPFVSATHAIVHSKVVIEPLDDSNSKALEIGY